MRASTNEHINSKLMYRKSNDEFVDAFTGLLIDVCIYAWIDVFIDFVRCGARPWAGRGVLI